MDKYEIKERIGHGAYGVVLKAKLKETDRVVAIKRLTLGRDNLALMRELCSIRNLHHRNILRYIDSFSSSDSLSIVTEYVPYNLNDVLLDPRRPKTDQFIRYFIHQILSGISHMHINNIMHRDMKPANILITRSLVVKIADFGQSRLFFPNETREYEENVATRFYRSPELLFGSRNYNLSVDIWALGCIFAKFYTRTPIFQGRTDIDQISRIFAVLGTPSDETWPSWNVHPDSQKLHFTQQAPIMDWSTLVKGASRKFLEFLQCCLKLEGTKRLTADNLLNHAYMKEPREISNYRILKRSINNNINTVVPRKYQERLPFLSRRENPLGTYNKYIQLTLHQPKINDTAGREYADLE